MTRLWPLPDPVNRDPLWMRIMAALAAATERLRWARGR